MTYRLTLAIIVFASAILTASCRPVETDATGPEINSAEADTLVLPDLLTPAGIAVASSGAIYALDSRAKQVMVYSPAGDLEHVFGGEGDGPGEFQRPMKLAIYDRYVMVSERSGLVSIFDLSGTFIRRIRANGVFHMSSSFSIVNDSLLVVGGLKEKPGDILGGTLAHMYSWDGELKKDFSEKVDHSRKNKVSVTWGISCDVDNGQTIWCVQMYEYAIYQYSLSGVPTDTLAVNAEYFKPLRDPQPTERSLQFEWLMSWDRPSILYSVNDSLFVVGVERGQRGAMIDLINKETGEIVDSREPPGRLMFVDKERQELYFLLPAQEEPEARYLVVPVEAYIASS